MTHWSHWSAACVAGIADAPVPAAPAIDRAALTHPLPGHHLWDHWPVQERDGAVAAIAGGALVMLLSASERDDPDERHAIARIRLMHRAARGAGWTDLGVGLPDGPYPGSREWAGSAVVDPDHRRLTLYYTAAGLFGENRISYAQRLFETEAPLDVDNGRIAVGRWSPPVESVAADGRWYMRDMEGGGGIGTIKAFRDPAWFRDPADGREYLLFAASLARSASAWNGAIGIARRENGRWSLMPPLLDADGVNNELERPHVVVRDGLYYLFWSTQRKVFADRGPAGPNGLYGMVANALSGPWRPLNGTGLVLANPPHAPLQAYSWLVLADLSVLSFADMVGLDRPPRDAHEARAHFGGVPAPVLRLRVDGERAVIA